MMKKLFQLMLFGIALLGLSEANAQCTVPTNMPYLENFDSTSTGSSSNPSLPTCWNFYETPSASGYAYNRASTWNSYSTPNYLYWYASSNATNNDTMMIISPLLSALDSSVNAQITFWARSTSSVKPKVFIGTMSDSTDASTLTILDTIDDITSVYAEYTMYFTPGLGYNGTDDYAVIGMIATASFQNLYMDDINFSTMSACAKPISLSVSNVTPTTATLGWSAIPSATTYNVIYGIAGFDPATSGTNTTATSNSLAVTGITASSLYDFYVVANCGVGSTSDTSAVSTFATGCAPVGSPYTQNFDATPTGSSINPSLPVCWTYYKSAGFGYGYTYTSTWTLSYSLPNQFRFYNSSMSTAGDTLMIVTPEIQGLDSSTKQMTFRAFNASTNGGDVFIGTMSDPTDPSTLNVLDTIALNLNYDEYTIYFDNSSGYNGTDDYVVIGHANSINYMSVYIDDIEITDIPPCPKPILVNIAGITNKSSIVSWTSGGSNFKIEYGPTGFTQGTGQFSNSSTNIDTLTGLAGNTCYDIYVQNDCSGAGNGTSVWTGPFTFCTLCNAMTAPFTENFDATTTGSSLNPSEPDCWTYTEEAVHNGYGYTYTSTWDPSYSVPNQWRMYNSNSSTKKQMLVSADIDKMDTNFVQTSIYARSTSSSATLIVGTMSDPMDATTFNEIDTISLTTTYTFYQVQFNTANGYNGTDTYIAYSHGNTGSFQTIFIDDIKIEPIPQCFPSGNMNASNVVQTSAFLNWTPGGGLKFQLEYGGTGFSQGTGTFVTVTDTFATISPLTAETCYDVWVRDSCATGWSPWFGPYTFCTPCAAKVTPYTENFDLATVGNFNTPSPPDCWSYYKTTGSNGYGYTYTSTWNAANSAPNQWLMTNSSNTIGQDVMLISPEIADLDSADKIVKFWARASSSFSLGEIVVGTVSSPSAAASFSAMDTIYLTTTFTEYSMNIHSSTGYNGVDKYVALAHGNSKSFQTLYLDDITFETAPNCAAPFSIGVDTITSTTAAVNWATVKGTCFKIEYGLAGFIQGTGNGTVVNNATAPTTLTGLTPNTFYDVYIADCCDSTNWSAVVSFKTECTSQLSGTYTVGGTVGPTNFATLDSAVSILNGCGVSGPVTFNLMGGTHNAIAIKTIAGASTTNTVTFNGSTAGDSIVAGSALTSAIEIDGASNVTFNNLYIENTGGNYVIWMHNEAANIKITNNTIMGNTSTTSFSSGVIVASASATSTSFGDKSVNNLTITGNTILGNYYGVTLYGTSTSIHSNLVSITNNTFKDQYNYGIRINYYDNLDFNDNYVSGLRNTFSYGAYINRCDYVNVMGNEIFAGNYGIYYYFTNSSATGAVMNEVSNNMTSANTGFYGYESRNFNLFHNTFNGGSNYGGYLGGSTWGVPNADSIDVRNNIFTSNTGTALWFNTTPSELTVDYNLYNSTTGNVARMGGSFYSTLSAWQAVDSLFNINSVEGDPVYLASDNLRLLLGTKANDVGDGTVGITVDIDGDVRPASGSTKVDMGADEYTPVTSDLSLDMGKLIKGECLNTTDTVSIDVINVLGDTLDMATTNVVANWTVTGPINSSGTITVNTGSLLVGDTLNMMAYTVDLSLPGTYYFNAYISPSSYNLSGLNDTLEQKMMKVNEVWEVTPRTDTIFALTDTVDLEAKSPYFGAGDFFITEVCHWRVSTGSPVGGWPSYLTADDYIEITGVPGSDLGGITLEQWSTFSMLSSYTFPQGTFLSASGTAIIMVGSGAGPSKPNDFYYNGKGTASVSYASSTPAGRILKDANGGIIDAVGYSGFSSYTFPAIAGVTSTDWSGNVPASSGTSGTRLEGADVNSATGWKASASSPQNPNTVNASVVVPVLPAVSGFTWTLNGTLVDTVPKISVGASANGVYNYIATYFHACDTFVDTATVYVMIPGLCTDPTNFVSNPDCKEVILTWTSDAGTTGSYMEFGPAGFIPSGLGMMVTSPDTVSGLIPGTAYDFYLVDSCSGGVTTALMISDTTTSDPVTAAFTWMQTSTTLSNAVVTFDASTSTGTITSYAWDFGNGNIGSGVGPTNTYSNNGVYFVTLIADGPCSSDTISDTVTVGGISIEETLIDKSLNIYPNPNDGAFRIEFQMEGINDVKIRVLDAVGREVYLNNVGKVSGVYRENIDISSEAKGMYIVQIISNGSITSRKLTVQ